MVNHVSRCTLGTACAYLFLCNHLVFANEALITFNYSGVVYANYGLASDLHTIAPIGSTFTGSFTFKPNAPATSAVSPDDISYLGALSDFTINFGTNYLSINNGSFRIQNDIERPPLLLETAPVYEDNYLVTTSAGVAAAPINVNTNILLSDYVSQTINSAWHFQWMRLSVTDLAAYMLCDASIPTIPPLLTPNTGFNLYFQLDCCTGRTEITGHIDSLEMVAATVPDGDLNLDGEVNAADVLIASRIATGQIAACTKLMEHGDVAPLQFGSPAPDSVINAADVLVILRKALGSINF